MDTSSRFDQPWPDSGSDSSLVSATSMSESSLPLLEEASQQQLSLVSDSSSTSLLYDPSDWDDEQPKPIPLQRTLRELEAAIQTYGPCHTKVASLWSALGLIRHHMQQLTAAAVQCHRAAICIYRQQESEESSQVDLAVALTDLGRCYEYLNESDKSVLLYQEAATILELSHQQSCFLLSVKRAQARLERR